MRNDLSLLVFLVIVLGGGTLIGFSTMPGPWYEALAKPAFNPPNWLFGPAWTLLYILIAIAGWRIWRIEPGGAAVKAWVAQLVANFAWSPVFFAAHMIGAALAVILVLLALIGLFMALAWRRDRVAALIFVPYAAWVAFATLLNATIWTLN